MDMEEEQSDKEDEEEHGCCPLVPELIWDGSPDLNEPLDLVIYH